MALRKYLLFFLFIFSFPIFASTDNLKDYFFALRQETIWPIKDSTNQDIISNFGPRFMYSDDRYDFHRGLDIAAAEDTKVKAVTDGVLFYLVNWEGAGNTVILQHTFNTPTYYHNKALTYYYTLYMHLSGFKYSEEDIGKTIKAGQVIGYVGQTGNATTPHLHLQLMVGSWYELETQLAYPSSPYSGFGFDPAVNPMLLFPPEAKNFSLALIQAPTKKVDGQITATFPAHQPLFNKAKLIVKDKATKQIVLQHVLNYNYRTGFDATTNDALDSIDTSKPYIYPDGNNTSVIIPKDNLKNYLSDNYNRILKVYDIWGRMHQSHF